MIVIGMGDIMNDAMWTMMRSDMSNQWGMIVKGLFLAGFGGAGNFLSR